MYHKYKYKVYNYKAFIRKRWKSSGRKDRQTVLKTWKIMIHSFKKKNSNLGFNKIKSLCSAKGTIKRVRRQATNWENIFIDHISDQRYMHPEYIKNSLNAKITDNLNGKWARTELILHQRKGIGSK